MSADARVRDRLPLLRRHDRRSRCPGAVILAWEGVRGRGRPPDRMADVSRRRRHLQRAAVDRAVPRERARRTRRSSSTTARPTARSSSCASASRRCASSSRRTAASARGWNAGMRADAGAATSCCSTRTRGLEDDALERLVAFAERASGRRRRRAAAAATRTARCSAPCAASRRSGGSRPSTSSCASSRRGRAR